MCAVHHIANDHGDEHRADVRRKGQICQCREPHADLISDADLVQAAFLALTHGTRGKAYILSDGKSYTSRAFSDLLQKELNVKHVWHIVAPLWVLWLVCLIAGKTAAWLGRTATLNLDKYRIMRQRNWQCDIEAARRELGYFPQWPRKRQLEWYRRSRASVSE